MTHTEGPWRAGDTYVFGPFMSSDAWVADCKNDWFDADEIKANARLIAAAPDLIRACIDTYKLLCQYSQGRAVDITIPAVEVRMIQDQLQSAISEAKPHVWPAGDLGAAR